MGRHWLRREIETVEEQAAPAENMLEFLEIFQEQSEILKEIGDIEMTTEEVFYFILDNFYEHDCVKYVTKLVEE